MTISLEVAAEEQPFPSSEGPVSASRAASWKWLAGKVAGSAATLLFVCVVNFFLFRVINPHPERVVARGRAQTPEQVELVRERLGVDEPLLQQFVTYMKNLVTLEFGDSTQYFTPVRERLLDAFWPTIALVGISTILSVIFGLWIGIVAAWNRGHEFDNISTSSTITLYSMPEWWLGMILFSVFSTGLWGLPRLFPVNGLHSDGVDPSSFDGVIDTSWHLCLPILTLTLAYLAEYSLIMRSALLDEIGQDYLQTARAKGLRDVAVRRRHATRNALLPVVTLVSLNLGWIVSGAITVETLFGIPGLGLLTYDALQIPDLPMLQGAFFLISAGVVVANLVSTLLYGWLDPRVRL
jgi:peptide/nickel transport system permease protein